MNLNREFLDFSEIRQFAEIVVFLSKKGTMSTPVILGKENWTNNPVCLSVSNEDAGKNILNVDN